MHIFLEGNIKMLKDKILEFIDALLTFFDTSEDIYLKLLKYRHDIKNRLSDAQVSKLFTQFITPNISNLIEQRDVSFLQHTFLIEDLTFMLNNSNDTNRDIIWKWMTSLSTKVKI